MNPSRTTTRRRLGGTQDQAGDGRDLEAAESGEHLNRIHVFGAMQRQSPRDDVRLPGDARVVEPRAAPGGITRVEMPVNAHSSAAAAVELPMPISPAPSRSPSGACAMPASIALLGLGSRHGRLAREIARRFAHAHVDDHRLDPVLAAQHRDGRAAGAKIRHHLPRDLLRKGTDAFLHHSVIRAEQQHRLAADRGHVGALNQSHLQSEFFQPPQTPGGLVSESSLRRIRSSSSVTMRTSPLTTPASKHRQDEDFDELLGEPEAVSVHASQPPVEPASRRLHDQHRACDHREPRPPSAQQRGRRSECASPPRQPACSASMPARTPDPNRPAARHHAIATIAARGTACAAIRVSSTRGVARYSSACQRATTLSRIAIAPYVPMRLSLRIAKTRSRGSPGAHRVGDVRQPVLMQDARDRDPERDRRQRGDGNRERLRGQQVNARARRAEHRAHQRKERGSPARRRIASAHRRDRQESNGRAKSHHLSITSLAAAARTPSSKLRRRPPRSADSSRRRDPGSRAPERCQARSRNPLRW